MTYLTQWNPFRFDRRVAVTPRRGVESHRTTQAGDPFDAVRNEMNQMVRALFNDDWYVPAARTVSQSNWFGDFAPDTFTPSVDVTSEENHLVVTAELPGVAKEDVDLSIEGRVLTISGEKKHERSTDENGCYRTERFFGSFKRAVPLPADVVADGAEARFDSGVLCVKFPRREVEEPKAKKIELT